MVAGVWLIVASLASGAGTLYLVARLWRYRDKPGARWFLVSLGCQAAWSVSYGVSLVVFRPAVRWALEVVGWGLLAGISTTFLAFALEYTGRGHIVERRWFRAVLLVPLAGVALGATNPIHGLVWTGFSLDPVAGLATVSYALRPWALVAATGGIAAVVTGSLLLFDTVVSYGRLYRTEAVAVGLSTLPPLTALAVWLYGLGPAPEVNFTTALLLPHVALDAYAFVRSDMFEFHPATRRAGERAAIDDLGNPVVIVDERGRIVTLNAAAQRAFGVEKRAAQTEPLEAYLREMHLDPAADERVSLTVDGTPRTYAVTTTSLDDSAGTHVGYTVVLQDVTEEIRREQRLQVLNRVVRHNLRNDMSVVIGFTEAAARESDDPKVREFLETARETAEGLVALGEHAREVERVLDGDVVREPVALRDLLAGLVADVRDDHPDAAVALDCPDVAVETDRETVTAICGALIENAVEHGIEEADPEAGTQSGSVPDVTVSVTTDPVAITVADDGPGIPDHELAVLETGEETDLEHGTGLGLWLVDWGTRRLGADVGFETTDGTTVTVTLPE